jgi:hypothetical protein
LNAGPSGVSTLTIRCWADFGSAGAPTPQGICGDGRASSANGYFRFYRYLDLLGYEYAGNDRTYAIGPSGGWPYKAGFVHCAVTAQYWSGGWIKTYIDGIQCWAYQILDSANLKVPDGNVLFIGAYTYNDTLRGAAGIIDDFNIEKYVMEPDDVAAYYQRTYLRYQDSRAQLILPSSDAEGLVVQQHSLGRRKDIFRVQQKDGIGVLTVDSGGIVKMPSIASIASVTIGSLTALSGYIASFGRGATALYEDHFAGLDTAIWASGGAGLGWGLTIENAASYPMGWVTFSTNASTGSATNASLYGNGGLGANQSPNFACAIEPSGEDLRNVASGFVGLFGGATARIGFVFASWGNAIKHSIYCVATSGVNESAKEVNVLWFSGASGGAGYAHKYAVSVISGASALFYIDNVLKYSTGAAVLWPSCMNPMVWFSYAEPGATKTLYWRTDYFHVYGRPNNP